MAKVPEPMRANAKAALAKFEAEPDLAKLKEGLAKLEGQAAQVLAQGGSQHAAGEAVALQARRHQRLCHEQDAFTRVHQRECNWFQSLEGDIDTSHFGFLHIGGLKMEEVPQDTIHKWGVGDRAP